MEGKTIAKTETSKGKVLLYECARKYAVQDAAGNVYYFPMERGGLKAAYDKCKELVSAALNSNIVAVRCEGCFTEWYSPDFKDPYEDNAEYREYYNNYVLPFQPVIGPSLGDANDEYLTSDLQCHAERMCCDAEDWDKATSAYADAIKQCIADGKPRTFKFEGLHDVKITPYTKENLPPVNEDSLGEYAEFKELIRERVAALYR